MKEKILLTGASGSVGREALKFLTNEDKYAVTVFDVKNASSQKTFERYKNIEIVYGDITNEDDVRSVVKGKDKIIHLAAIIPPLADDKPDLARSVNVEGTKNILKNMDSDAFLLYASSVSVYGDRVDNPMIRITDSLEPSPRDKYAETKIEAEKNIRESGKNWTIFRLSAIMGYGNHKISPIMFHMPLETSIEITTPSDTARAFVNGLKYENELLHKIFNLGGGEYNRTTYREFLGKSFCAFGLGKVNFPNKTFAEKNFHCGYYADGDDLENIVHFRQDTLVSYFEKVEKSVSPVKRFFAGLFRGIVKFILLKKSEPYKACKENNKKEMEHYFRN